MPIRRYIPSSSFTPEQMNAMGIAFEEACAKVKVGTDDEERREAVAHLIIALARADSEASTAELRDRAIKLLGEFSRR